MVKKISFILFSFLLSTAVWAAVGCDLNDPDRDVQRFFPDSTGYKTDYVSIQKSGGAKLQQSVELRLGDKFKGLYETADVPYTVYTILKGKTVLGYIHGVNQKGKYGGIQVFLILTPNGRVIELYYQKMTAPYAGKFRERAFGQQFKGLTLKDMQGYNAATGKIAPNSSLQNIKNPAPEAVDDFKATLRGVKKNLILMDVFKFSRVAK